MPVLSVIQYFNGCRRKDALKIFLVFLLSLAWTGSRSQSPSLEYQIKAVFLFNFTQFVQWPVSTFPENDSPLVIGILGDDPFKEYLDKTVQGEKTEGHPLVVQRFDKVEQIKTCQILFINIKDRTQLKYIFEKLKTLNVLTVGDTPNFSKEGGMIRFFTENDKTRIRINLEVVKNSGLTISSKLLRLADVVSSQNDFTP
jgi:hypothetical protein